MQTESEQRSGSRSRLANLPWPWRIGLGVPLLLGAVLASGAAVSWLTGSNYRPPERFAAGYVEEFEIAAPRYFEEERLWIVRLDSGDFLALYDRDPRSECTVPWRPKLEFAGRKGWFRDVCLGSNYDLLGVCHSGPCTRNLDRFTVDIMGGEVIVNLRELVTGGPP